MDLSRRKAERLDNAMTERKGYIYSFLVRIENGKNHAGARGNRITAITEKKGKIVAKERFFFLERKFQKLNMYAGMVWYFKRGYAESVYIETNVTT